MPSRTSKFAATLLILLGGLFVWDGRSSQSFAAESSAGDSSALAAHLIETTGMTRGICSVLDWDDDRFVLSTAEAGEFLVHAWGADADKVAAARKTVDAANLLGTTAIVERGSLAHLPYGENMVDVVLASDISPEDLQQLSVQEIMRTLRPQGKAVIGGPGKDLTSAQLKAWLQRGGITDAKIQHDDFGLWAVITKPRQKGADNWSHWEHSPDNNPVSNDDVIKAPYMTKWLGLPFYTCMPAITTAAGGRVFNAIGHIAHHKREEAWLNTLIARNGYNGTILWTRKLPNGYLVHRSAFIATDDVYYMIDTDGSGCLMLDPETGNELGRINAPGAAGQWKWMAMHDGVLYALVGSKQDSTETTVVRSDQAHWSWGELSKGYYQKQVPWGFGKTLVAFDLAAKKRLWLHREKQPIDSRAMVIGKDKIFLYCPNYRLVGLDAKTGKELWENRDKKVHKLIEQEGRGLASTPGFRSMTYCVYTPDALIFQAQTRMNVVAISTSDGYALWNKKKTTNNPNALFLDNTVVLGVGKGGTTQMIDPATGNVVDDLGFTKRSCARLTATSDSLFCRGWPEGLTRFDRKLKKVTFNGAFRPGCNDGMVAANGLLYAGPWPCDCNLMVLGRIALTSAGDFRFDYEAKDAERLEVFGNGELESDPLQVTAADWSSYRGNSTRGSATTVATRSEGSMIWEYEPTVESLPTAVVAAGDLIFIAGDDGQVRAINANTGNLKWSFATAGPILQPPTIWNGRAYVGSGDGYVYALEANTGRLLWRFRAAPIERRIPVYGKLASTWPVHSGVLVENGVAYAAAGMIDYDGTYVYALDAVTGELRWQNNSSGHLEKNLRKGVSANGNLTIADGRLWMPGGNVVSPAIYDLASGEYQGSTVDDGSPKSNRGEEIGVFRGKHVVLGGRLRFSPLTNIVNPGSFSARTIQSDGKIGAEHGLHQGRIPPAWNDKFVAMVDGRLAVPAGYDADVIEAYLNGGSRPKPKWVARDLQGGDTVALAVTPNAVLAVCEMPQPRDRHGRWIVCALDIENGIKLWEQRLPDAARAGGLTVDREGRVYVVLEDGHIHCIGGEDAVRASILDVAEQAQQDEASRQNAIQVFSRFLKTTDSNEVHSLMIEKLELLGVDLDGATRKNGGISRWRLIAPFPWNEKQEMDAKFIGEPNIDTTKNLTVEGRLVKWRHYLTDEENGMVDLAALYGRLQGVAAYAYAEVELPAEQELLLKIGSNDGFKCWFNGEVVGRWEGSRSYGPDQDVLKVRSKAGTNQILLKITQLGSNWALGVRITDRDGRPISIK